MTAVATANLAWVIWPVVLVCCAGLDSFYCGMETGMYVLNKIRLELRAEGGSRSARLLRRMLGNSNNLLAVLLVGTNLTRYAATFAVTSMFVMAGYGERAEWYTIAVATPLLFVIGDAVPKSVFRRGAESLVYRFAWLLGLSDRLFNATGLATLVRGISAALTRRAGQRRAIRSPLGHEGIATAVAEGHASGVLTSSQSTMASRVINIGTVTLASVLHPMRRVVTAPADVSRKQLTNIIRRHDYSRLPLLDSSSRVVGVLDIYDVLAEPNDVAPIEKASEPFVLPAEMNVTEALYSMQRARKAIAVAVDEANNHVGIVTIKDLVEEIVGDLEAW